MPENRLACFGKEPGFPSQVGGMAGEWAWCLPGYAVSALRYAPESQYTKPFATATPLLLGPWWSGLITRSDLPLVSSKTPEYTVVVEENEAVGDGHVAPAIGFHVGPAFVRGRGVDSEQSRRSAHDKESAAVAEIGIVGGHHAVASAYLAGPDWTLVDAIECVGVESTVLMPCSHQYAARAVVKDDRRRTVIVIAVRGPFLGGTLYVEAYGLE